MVSTKTWNSTIVFNTDNNKKKMLSTKLAYFWNQSFSVTLKTEVMTAENVDLPSQE